MRTLTVYLMMLFVLLLSCGAPGAGYADETGADDLPEVIYILPFLNVMMPQDFSGAVFDGFIDKILLAGKQHGFKVRILKQGELELDKEWLAKQYHVRGELFGYIEESGCCATELEATSRVYLHRPGVDGPVAEIEVPAETFFDHDLSTLAKERARLAGELSSKLAAGLIATLIQ